ncbi:MAG: aldo/keto reductase [Burkholderiales bacterium]|nr:aldo/keto reductase [Burkholderiales bacterium]
MRARPAREPAPEPAREPTRGPARGPAPAGRRRALLGAAAAVTLGATAAAPPLARAIPATGERVPVVGLGTWQVFDVAAGSPAHAAARETLAAFAAAGGRVVDSSPMYGRSEEVLGELMAAAGLRSGLFVATKVWTRGRAAGLAQMRASMEKLRLDTLDLMQVHNLVDTEAHLATLAGWRKEGRVRLLGLTHYHAGAHGELEAALRRHRVDAVQVNYSLAEPEAGERLLAACADAGAAVIVNRPFAEGALFARVRGKALPAWAGAELGVTSWAQYFLKWILGAPEVTVAIPGTRNPRHAADNLAAARGPLPDARARARMRDDFERL